MEIDKSKKNEITTIKLSKETKDRLEKLRSHKRDSYNDILVKIFEVLNTLRVNPETARGRLINLDRQNRNLKD